MGEQQSVLVLNCGSSSLKFAMVTLRRGDALVVGLAECLGSPEARLVITVNGERHFSDLQAGDHQKAIDVMLARMVEIFGERLPIIGIGHRVVHGGERFSGPALLDDTVEKEIQLCATFAPLHNPANLIGIRGMRKAFPRLPQVAVFDTAFHQTMPQAAFMYAIPHELYTDRGIRRYGFHGTSHAYITSETVGVLGLDPQSHGLVTVHLGNGCSACAVCNGQSVETTMGLSPLEGMAMGTRSGDVDPDLPRFLAELCGMDQKAVSEMLNRRSGLLGLSGVSSDMRAVLIAEENGNQRAKLAVEVFVHRTVRAVFSMASALARLDAIVFTGGIGENSAEIRKRVGRRLRLLGVELSAERNETAAGGSVAVISAEASRTTCLVVPTNEELMIAREVVKTMDTHGQLSE